VVGGTYRFAPSHTCAKCYVYSVWEVAGAAPAVSDVAVGRVVRPVVLFAHKRSAPMSAPAAVNPAQQQRRLRGRRYSGCSGDQVGIVIDEVAGGTIGVHLRDVVVV
jgi:hypothetical protein